MLARWNDWSPLSRFSQPESRDPVQAFRRELGRLLFDFDPFSADFANAQYAGYPRVTLEDNGAAYVLRAEVPGLTEKELDLNVEGDTVTIKGERTTNVPEGYSVHRRERATQRFARSFSLPAQVDSERAEASLQHGVLTVTIPKAQQAQPRKISVRAH